MTINNMNNLLCLLKEDRNKITQLINKEIINKDQKFLHHLISILSFMDISEHLEFLKQIDISLLKKLIHSVNELKTLIATLGEKDQAFLLALLGRDHLRKIITLPTHMSSLLNSLHRINYSLLSNILGESYLRNIYWDVETV